MKRNQSVSPIVIDTAKIMIAKISTMDESEAKSALAHITGYVMNSEAHHIYINAWLSASHNS